LELYQIVIFKLNFNNSVALILEQIRGDRFRVFYFQSNFNLEIPEQVRNGQKSNPELIFTVRLSPGQARGRQDSRAFIFKAFSFEIPDKSGIGESQVPGNAKSIPGNGRKKLLTTSGVIKPFLPRIWV